LDDEILDIFNDKKVRIMPGVAFGGISAAPVEHLCGYMALIAMLSAK